LAALSVVHLRRGCPGWAARFQSWARGPGCEPAL